MHLSWKAIYSDGTSLSQFDDDGQSVSSEHIDRSKLVSLVLLDGIRPVLVQNFDPGQRLIYRHRKEQSTNGRTASVYLVGWQETIGDRNIQHISVVFDDGHVENICRWNEKHRWFNSPAWVPADLKPIGE